MQDDNSGSSACAWILLRLRWCLLSANRYVFSFSLDSPQMRKTEVTSQLELLKKKICKNQGSDRSMETQLRLSGCTEPNVAKQSKILKKYFDKR